MATGEKQEPRQTDWQTLRRAGALAGTLVLLGCVAAFLWISRAWPLVNDAALMDYVVFLMRHGMAPYREINDINLPGAYVPQWLLTALATALHLPQAVVWRWMDAGVLLLAGLAMVRIARPHSWFAGVFAGALFALYHGRDGIGQAGQRDLWMTTLLLWAVALLLDATRRPEQAGAPWRVGCYGLLLGVATTIKPFAAAYLFLVMLFVRRQRGTRKLLLWAGAGFALPLLAAWIFLLRWHAAGAFSQVLRVDLPYHAALARGSVAQLLAASSVPSILELLCLLGVAAAANAGSWRASWAAGFTTRSPERTGCTAGRERLVIALCALLGLLSYVAQGKGYPYQRYPYLAFLFLLAALEFTGAAGSDRPTRRAVGAAGFVFGVAALAPSYVREAQRAHWPSPVRQAIERELARQAGTHGVGSLNRNVQCIDSVSGCTDALLHLQLEQATGSIYDELLFPGLPAPWGTQYSGPPPGSPVPAAVQAGQGRFRAALLAHPPRILIVSAWLFPEGPGDYGKLALWPWFDAYLRKNYTLVSEQSFPRAENGPMGFRVYVRCTPGQISSCTPASTRPRAAATSPFR